MTIFDTSFSLLLNKVLRQQKLLIPDDSGDFYQRGIENLVECWEVGKKMENTLLINLLFFYKTVKKNILKWWEVSCHPNSLQTISDPHHCWLSSYYL